MSSSDSDDAPAPSRQSDSDEAPAPSKQEQRPAYDSSSSSDSDSEAEAPVNASPKATSDARKEFSDDSDKEESGRAAGDDEGTTRKGSEEPEKGDSGEEDRNDEPNEDGRTSEAHTYKQIFGDSDSEDSDKDTGLKGARVLLNKETGQLERGEAVPAPASVFDAMHRSDGDEPGERSLLRERDLPITIPVLQRPPTRGKLCYVKIPKQLQLEPNHWEGSLRRSDGGTVPAEHVIRWRYHKNAAGDQRQSNARIVEWSDGSKTMHIGSKAIFEILEAPLETNLHHIFVRQDGAIQTDTNQQLDIAEAHGVLSHKLTLKSIADAEIQKKMHQAISKRYQQKADKSEMLLKKSYDEKEEKNKLIQKEQPDDAALRRAKSRAADTSEESEYESDSSSASSTQAARKRKAGAGGRKQDSSSESSSDSGEGEVVVKKTGAKKPAPRKGLSDSDSDSD